MTDSPALTSILEDVKEDVLDLMERSTDRAVMQAIMSEGAPLVMAYRMRGVYPHPRDLQRLATYMIALAAAAEEARSRRRGS